MNKKSKYDLDQEYVVEAILNRRKINNVLEYQVKWENYPNSQNTWEPLNNLMNCIDLVLEFEEKLERLEKEKQLRKEMTNRMRNETRVLNQQKKYDQASQKLLKPKYKRQQKMQLNQVQSSDSEAYQEDDVQIKQPVPIKQKIQKPQIKQVSLQQDLNTAPPRFNENIQIPGIGEHQGHFKKGDKSSKIFGCNSSDGEIILIIEWQKRPNGFQPTNTKMSSAEVRQYDKDLIIDYYESKLKFVNKKKLEKNQESVQKQAPPQKKESDDGMSEDLNYDKN